MSRIIIISNRLPVTVHKKGGNLQYQKSIGGLATGLKGYHEQLGSIWVGWSGISDDEISEKEKREIRKTLKNTYCCLPVFLSGHEIDAYYYGFCNKTIWPLFHYFQSMTEYDFAAWESYEKVNEKFFEAVSPIIGDGDIIWIHDYQLMLLPQMIKEKFPNTQIGFFLHIPFPSYEIFRLLIWREEILHGLLGADLIGFHTYDYVRHFVSSASRLLGLERNLNRLGYEDRYVQVDAFPMGIDYAYFSHESGRALKPAFKKEDNMKIVLSIDRLDYTKGIPERIRAFSLFLSRYPEYRGHVKMYLIVAPSREEVDTYEALRKEISEQVAEVNGKYGTVNWMPIWYFYQAFPQEELISFYRHADVMLVTPLRDGMNLVVKEYIAARTDCMGMVVLSETTGAASELGETVIVNANDLHQVASGIKYALEMSDDEKKSRNIIMNERLKRYNVHFWASEFIDALGTAVEAIEQTVPQKRIDKDSSDIENAYAHAKKRILFLDYDGTLVPFSTVPEQAKPDPELRALLSGLADDRRNTVVIISGRDRYILEKWFQDPLLHILAAHGLWFRAPNKDWITTVNLDNTWKNSVRHILELYTDRMPGSFIEEKDYSLAFHYRKCDPDMIKTKIEEMRVALLGMTYSMSLGLQEGNKVLEIKDNRANKGYGASLLLQNVDYDFILAAGDDHTDEDMFSALPGNAYRIKIGPGDTHANYRLKSFKSIRALLTKLRETS